MNTTTRIADGFSELSSRSANGIDVALLWQRRHNTAVVVVVDRRSGENLVLDVAEDDSALDVFNHPYAYAARRRVDAHTRSNLRMNSRMELAGQLPSLPEPLRWLLVRA